MCIQELRKEFEAAVEVAQAEADYYKKWQGRFRRASFFIRVFSVSAFLIATVTAFGAKDSEKLSLALMAVAGILGICDQVFLISSNWRRYAKARLEIELLIAVANIEWAELLSKMTSEDVVSPEHRQAAFQLFKNLVKDTKEISISETRGWDSELEVAMKQLGELTKSSNG
ncbi:SLATT domain-containing protein [Grimontia marina]|uniref:SMODS and SLOG-associating 2TM effector domain-containing protein n=1 Tax=Grimontia marina TaxID=646534 RepID=A0A128EZK7_9GAMM|nr:SLATT domain-containing protein [Grimontia marina]CZF79436.1 hypothetical protein GMA8713_00972 [Grimontia marina]